MKVIFPGTFDPVTIGHEDLISRAARLFQSVVVAVADNKNKKPMFTLEERVGMVEQVTSAMPNVSVQGFSGLLAEFAKNQGAMAVVRGLRAVSDFEYEFQLSAMNRHLASEVETVFLTPEVNHSFVSSSLVKEVAMLGGDVTAFVSAPVKRALESKSKG